MNETHYRLYDANVRMIKYDTIPNIWAVEVYCAGSPQHGWNWVQYNSFTNFEDAMSWAHDPANVA